MKVWTLHDSMWEYYWLSVMTHICHDKMWKFYWLSVMTHIFHDKMWECDWVVRGDVHMPWSDDVAGRTYCNLFWWRGVIKKCKWWKEYEKKVSQTFSMSFSPGHTLETAYEDQYDTREMEEQTKKFSAGKSGKEGHAIDAISDSLFRITLMVCVSGQVETQNKV